MKAFPEISLEDAIASAIKNRNEVGAVRFMFKLQDMNWTHMKVTNSPSSSAYKKQQVAYLQASQTNRLIESQMEMDIRYKYSDLLAKKLAAENSESTLALVQESYRIANLSYNMGMSTLTDLQATAAQLEQVKLARIAAITSYNQAVEQFGYACGVGTTRISL